MKLLCGSLLLLFTAGAYAQSSPSLTFVMDRTGPPAEHYQIRVDQATGHGFYQAGPDASSNASSATEPITVNAAIENKLFAAVPIIRSNRCESHSKGIAQTGRKTLRFEADATPVECTYNYSDEDRVNTATTLFEAIGETMQYGDRLAAKLRFDRLGLDAEIDNLQSALGDGRAVEVGNIAPVLQSIANDERVMERVQRKAVRLLQSAGDSGAQPAGGPSAGVSSDR